MPPSNRQLTLEEFRRLDQQGLTIDQILGERGSAAQSGQGGQTYQPPQPSDFTGEQDYGFFRNLGVGVAQGVGQVGRNVGLLGRRVQRGIGSLFGLDPNSSAYGGESRFDRGTAAYEADSRTLEPRGVGQNIGNIAGQIFPATRAYNSLTRGVGGVKTALGVARDILQRGTAGALIGGLTSPDDNIASDALFSAGADTALSIISPSARPLRQALASNGVVGAVNDVSRIVTQPAGKILGYGKEYVDKLFLGAAQIISNRSPGVLQEIYRNPRGAITGFSDIRESADYENYITGIRSFFKGKERSVGAKYNKLVNSPTTDRTRNLYDKPVSDNRIRQELNEALTEYARPISIARGGLNPDADVLPLTFGDGLLDSERNRLQEVFTMIRNQKDKTPVAINNLAQDLSQDSIRGNDRATVLIDNIRRRLRTYAGSRNSNVALANEQYRSTRNILDLIGRQLAVKPGVAAENLEGVQDTANNLARIFGDVDLRHLRNFEDEVGISIVGRSAGRALVEDRLSSGSSILEQVLRLVDPRAVGRIVATAGLVNKGLSTREARAETAQFISKTAEDLSPRARLAVTQIITRLFGGENEERDNATQTPTQY